MQKMTDEKSHRSFFPSGITVYKKILSTKPIFQHPHTNYVDNQTISQQKFCPTTHTDGF